MIRTLKADVVFFGYGNLTHKIITDLLNKNQNVLCISNNSKHSTIENGSNFTSMTYQSAINYQIISNSSIFTWRRIPNLVENKNYFFEWLRSDSFLTEHSFLLSSASVYRDSPTPLTESQESLELQVGINGKYLLEIMLTDLINYKNATHINLRVSNVYGANLDYGFIGSLMKLIAIGSTTDLVEDQEVVRDYIYVDDVVYAIQELMKIKPEKEILNISTGIGTTTSQVFEIFTNKGFNFQKISMTSQVKNLKKISILNCNELASLIDWKPIKVDSALSLMLAKYI